ncbi:MAG: hypothetical protein ABI147_01650 [Acidobacteriaceae bacterium]
MPFNRDRSKIARRVLLPRATMRVVGIFLLCAVVFCAADYVVPKRFQPWFGVFAGLFMVVLAIYLLLRAWSASQTRTLHVEHGHGGHASHIHWPAAREKIGQRGDWAGTGHWPMIVSALAMLVAGIAIVVHALHAAGISFRLASLTALRGNHLASFVGVVGLGLFLGMRHSTDPDHVVAVSTIVARERSVRQGAMIGMMWGLGHTLTIFIVGAAIILFKLTIPPRIGLSMEMAVAAMLILLGVLNLSGVLQRVTERLTPVAWTTSAGDLAETFAEKKRPGRVRGLLTRFGYYQLLRPLAIGLVHGLAGSAAVALLVLSMIHSPAWAIAYLVVFGLGTVVGMMLMTTVMAIPIALTGRKSSRYLTIASGLVSICFGMFLVYHLGFVDGLFTSHVHWTPE